MSLTKRWLNIRQGASRLFSPNSIRQRIIGYVMGFFIVASGSVGFVGFWFANHEVQELFDARLAQHARLLLTLTSEDVSQPHLVPTYLHAQPILQEEEFEEGLGHEYESKIYFQVRLDDNVVVATDETVIVPQHGWQPGFGFAYSGDNTWRTFYLERVKGQHLVRVYVGERTDIRQELVSQIVWQSLLPEMFGLPLIALLVWWAIGVGLAPLMQLTRSIASLEPNALKSLDIKHLGSELEAVQQAINHLLTRLEELMAREKRWIADAAHELRTPLAVLKIHAQNAQNAPTEADRQASLKALDQGVERSSRMVAQLLAYARIEHNAFKTVNEPIDVVPVTRATVAELLPLAWDRQVDIEFLNEEGALKGKFAPADIEMVLQNLVSNAVKFSPPQGVVTVEWYKEGDILKLAVKDQGPGVSDESKPRLTERFYRNGQAQGAGLGLAIVRSVMKVYGGEVMFQDNQPHGLCVVACFPSSVG